jgi:dual specificity tyrosine-phosphorylation-regulated kinase 2/3/4
MATPEYMPPEILNYILFQNDLEYDKELLKKIEQYKNPWVIDIWSVGCIILEIVCGVPLWMSIKSTSGLFAVKGRLFPKIIAKQIEAVKKLDHHLDFDNHSGIRLTGDMRTVLKRMLHLEPASRISPREVLTTFGVECPLDRFPFY